MSTHYITDFHLSLEDVERIIGNNETLALSEEAADRIQLCRDYLDQKLADNDRPIYGINTGFGALHNTEIGKEDLNQLQENLVKSHACGVGEKVPLSHVKLMLLLKIQS